MKVRAYLSHPICGVKGKDATDRDMEQNCQKAIVAGKILELCFPNLEVYIPGEHDEFVALAWRQNKIPLDTVLEIDCDILNKRDLLIIYGWQSRLSNGMITEINYATEHDIPIFSMTQISETTIDGLKLILDEIVLKKKRVNEYLN